MTLRLDEHAPQLPTEVADALSETYGATIAHLASEEWDDLQVDAGRFCEAVMRCLEWRTNGSYTPIDGKSKPNRARVVGAAKNDLSLPPTPRAQVPQRVELIVEFRNNRNSAHLGDTDANRMDAVCVLELVTWTIGEILRLETEKSTHEGPGTHRSTRRAICAADPAGGKSADRARPTGRCAAEGAVALYENGEPIHLEELRTWAEYGNSTRWRRTIIKDLEGEKFVHLDDEDYLHLLRPGQAAAERLMLKAA